MTITSKANAPAPGTTDATGINMDFYAIWDNLSYTDGFLFSVWVGMMYYGKCWIDHKFKCKEQQKSV